jgi:molybdopterin-guanine dinucleotide biosynthesis protein A
MNIDGFVLVGGRSSRLGEDKASLLFGSETLAVRAARVIEGSIENCHVRLVASSSWGKINGALLTGIPFVFDLYEGRGALGGLHAALANAATEWAFIAACDYPFISGEFISLLQKQVSDEYETVVPVQTDSRIQPLCGFYRVLPWLNRLEEILTRTTRVPPPLFRLCENARSRLLPYSEYSWIPNSQNLFLNVNTREDLDKAVNLEHKLSARTVI